MAPSPNRFHQVISRNLCRLLFSYLHESRVGTAYNAPLDVYLDELNVVQPDVVFLTRHSSAKNFAREATRPARVLEEIDEMQSPLLPSLALRVADLFDDPVRSGN